MLSELFENLKLTTAIITPNRRLALYLCEEFNNYQIINQKVVWDSANINFIDDWLEQLFYSQSRDHILLNSHQEQILWEKIIIASDAWNNTLSHFNTISNVATSVQDAWKLTRQWCSAVENWSSLQLNENHLAFKNWASEFINLCQVNHWVDNNSVIPTLIHSIDFDTLALPQEIILVNFDQIYPQLQQLIAKLEARGCKISYFDTNKKCGCQQRISFASSGEELNAMATWAKTCVQNNPKAKIGCVVPNLEALRSQVEYIFDAINSEHFDISIGKPLTKFPIICDALTALKLGLEHIPISNVARLLRSPFFNGSQQEMVTRAMLDRQLRKTKEYMVTVRQILALAKTTTHGYFCPILAVQIDEFLLTLRNQPKKQSFSGWANCFIEQLNLLGFGVNYNFTSMEYQLLERWWALLKEFGSLDLLEQPATFVQALNRLNIVANNCIFQPKLTKPAPIKILGVLEAAGLNFEHLWVMGLTDENWPPAPKPNAFIPWSVQKDLSMPHADAERELAFCRGLIQRFGKSADDIIYSYPLQDKEREYHPSPLIVNFDTISEHNFLASIHNGAPVKLETILDNRAPTIMANEPIHGGTKIFKLQAACPFRAFAECRLMAQELESPKIGLDYIERGSLVHAALARFWNKVNTHQQLKQYTEQELQTIIAQCIAESVFEVKLSVQDEACLRLEHKRLQKILFDWLQLEKQRSNFKVIAKEQILETTIADIAINLRMDRVDELEDGSLLIIDYKTGEVSFWRQWDDARPDDPQLPLYCIASNQASNAGAVIAQLKNGKLGFLGITKKNYGFAKGVAVVDNWHEILDKWQSILEQLGNDFRHGDAKIDPKYGEKTCSQCSLRSLCRM